jgi:hypothetical protein
MIKKNTDVAHKNMATSVLNFEFDPKTEKITVY